MSGHARTAALLALCLTLGIVTGCARQGLWVPVPVEPGLQVQADIRRAQLLQPRGALPATADIVPERPSAVTSLPPGAITHGPLDGDMVALTLDDGPSTESESVLDILQQERAAATFFYVGDRVPFNPWAARRAVALGCDVEDHTLTHVELVGLNADAVVRQVLGAREIIYRYTGTLPMWVRPRAGRADVLAGDVVGDLGMGLVLWDTDSADTIDPGRTAEGIARNAISRAHPGSIILLHETNPLTVEALPRIIEGLRARGFRLVTLTKMLGSPAQAQAEQ